MATASEGKTSKEKVAHSNVKAAPLCDACEHEKSVKYCLACPGSLCDNCTKSHMTSKLTTDHTLLDLTHARLNASYVGSGESPRGLSKCRKHPSKELEHFCKDCTCFVCTDCKRDHKEHKILPARNDISVYRSAHHDNMKKMLDEVHDLEQYKINLKKTIQQYEDACGEVDDKAGDLIKTINEQSKHSKAKLRAVQDELKQLLGNAQSGLIKELEGADKKVSKLRDLRKVDDCEIMSHALASSNEDIKRLHDYKKNITLQARTVPTKKILPYDKEIESIKESIYVYFATESVAEIKEPSDFAMESYSNMAKETILSVKNPKGKHGYRFSKAPMASSLILHGTCTDDMRVFDINKINQTQTKCDFEILNITTVYHNEHVIVHGNHSNLSLLDNNFKVIFTQNIKWCRAICYYKPRQFVALEIDDKEVYLTIMSVKENSFRKRNKISVAEIKEPWYIEMYPDKENVCVACPEIFYKVNLSNSNFTKHDMSKTVGKSGYTYSLFVDDKSAVLVGDGNGSVHKFDKKMNHTIVAKIGNLVRDVYVKDGQLLVSSIDNQIHVFS